MKKLVFTLAFGLFFVAFTNAQTATTEKQAEADQVVEVVSASKEKAADKKAKTSDKKAACDTKKKSCASKRPSCGSKK